MMHCGKHCINALVGEHWATTQLMEETAQKLRRRQVEEAGQDTLMNPYRHWAGAWVGNWDLMVMVEALRTRRLGVTQHVIYNERAPDRLETDLAEFRSALAHPTTVGVIVNRESTSWWLKMVSGHHWFSLRRVVEGRQRRSECESGDAATAECDSAAVEKETTTHRWYNVDSHLRTPELVGTSGSADAVVAFV